MTLILMSVRQSEIVLVSDRRLSWNGTINEHELCKTGQLRTSDATAVYAFSGLVRNHHFELSHFIGDTICPLPGDSTFETCLLTLAESLTRKFENNFSIRHLDKQKRALTIAFGGYDNLAYPTVWVVSNHEGALDDPGPVQEVFKTDSFKFRPGTQAASGAYIFGNRAAVPQSSLLEFNGIVRGEAPPAALKFKAAELIRIAADDPKSCNTIGSTLMAVTLPTTIPPFNPAMSSHYMSPLTGDTIYMADDILVSPEGNRLMRDITLCADADIVTPHASGEALCHCGSGKRFRFCHGRQGGKRAMKPRSTRRRRQTGSTSPR